MLRIQQHGRGWPFHVTTSHPSVHPPVVSTLWAILFWLCFDVSIAPPPCFPFVAFIVTRAVWFCFAHFTFDFRSVKTLRTCVCMYVCAFFHPRASQRDESFLPGRIVHPCEGSSFFLPLSDPIVPEKNVMEEAGVCFSISCRIPFSFCYTSTVRRDKGCSCFFACQLWSLPQDATV